MLSSFLEKYVKENKEEIVQMKDTVESGLPKFCKDCKHFVNGHWSYEDDCKRRVEVVGTHYDLVRGTSWPKTEGFRSTCKAERLGIANPKDKTGDTCGKEGKYWEKK